MGRFVREVLRQVLSKTIILFFSLLALAGCTSVQIPEYIQDKNPYKREFAASFDETLSVTKEALKDLGWQILETYDPAVFEQTRHLPPGGKQLLLFTESKQSSMILYSRYVRLNIYLRSFDSAPWPANRPESQGGQDRTLSRVEGVRSLSQKTEVEIRYAAITSLPVKNLKSYKNKRLVDRLFDQIAADLKK